MSNALRLLIVAGIAGLGSYTFNGSIKPVTTIIVISTVVIIGLSSGLARKRTAALVPAINNF